MKGYALCLKPGQNTPGYQYIRDHSDELVPFDFEESSIDLASITTPRVVVNDICYQIERQYFVRISDSNTERIIICKPILTASENPQLVGHNKPGIRYNGMDSYTYNKLLEKKAAEEAASKSENESESTTTPETTGSEDTGNTESEDKKDSVSSGAESMTVKPL